jgi:DNA-binding transcriptional MerR regulator
LLRKKCALIVKKISGGNGSWPILLSNGGRELIDRLMTSMATHLPQQRTAQKTEIPDKLYFRIGEVARLCSVAPYVLRFWETEFSQLRPNKSGTGQRLYRRRDVEMALRVKRLLYDEGYTIAGARQAIQAETRSKRSGQPELPLPQQQQVVQKTEARLHKVRKELREIMGMLAGPVPQLQIKERSAPTPAAKPGLFEL